MNTALSPHPARAVAPESLGVHLDLDGAARAAAAAIGLGTIDLTSWGPRLRFIASSRQIERFAAQTLPALPPFVLTGSGDFHHLTALWLRRVERPFHLLSFDNHPDWDRRPPRWACGGWLNRALELPRLERATVWGCGNFELEFPARLFGRRSERLEIRPWRERLSAGAQRRFRTIDRGSWRSEFGDWAQSLAGARVYVTIDLDCLRDGDAATNWEQGLFERADLVWALRELRSRAQLVGGDICGPWSPPVVGHWFQRLAWRWDHPRLPAINPDQAAAVNTRAVATLWPALTGGSPS